MSKAVIRAFFLLSLPVSVPSLLHAAPSTDSFEMRVIATVPYSANWRYVCGDADNDGNPEFYGERSPDFRGYAVEHVGGNQFDTTFIVGRSPLFSDLSDADRDGKADLLLQSNAPILHVFESPDSGLLPTRRAWTDTIEYVPSFMYACIADIDLDSAREIWAADDDDHHVHVYENAGDDLYPLVTQVTPPDPLNPHVLAVLGDMDRDGRPEMGVGTWWGSVLFYEAVADDSFEFVADSSLMAQPYVRGLAAAPDMDQDGRPEAVVVSYNEMNEVLVAVYESPCADSYAVVWSRVLYASRVECGGVAVGDIDGDSVPEFAITDGLNIRIYRCLGNDAYGELWSVRNQAMEVAIYDINADGKNELLYRQGAGFGTTVIRQYVSLGLSEQTRRRLEQVVVVPTVVGRGGVVRIAGIGEVESSPRPSPQVERVAEGRVRIADGGVRVEVLDATGRCAEGCDKVAFSGGVAVWNTRGVVPGAYFIRVSSGGRSITRKVLILP